MKIDNTPSRIHMDEIEDLTLFADESFDTDDVDLFEFSEDQGSSLITLKTIILSLDWEINDKILQELSDETNRLQQMWEEDKVAQVYLQGLAKVGRYLEKEGAYAHPNAIKLLLTFFYDFEKIISSPDISGDSITALLKTDVRKFKILQYQIEQKDRQTTVPGDKIETQDADHNRETGKVESITFLKQSVLELEWEITDSTLEQFNIGLAGVQPQFENNRSARIIIHGLQVLGKYIDDERTDAHPSATNLVNYFFDGLELIVQENISEKEINNILIDRVNKLNNLKMLLATSKEQKQTDAETVDIDDLTFLLGAEQDTDPGFSEEILNPAAITPVFDEITDKFIDEKLNTTTTVVATPPGSDQGNGVSTVEEDLELFFTSDDDDLPDKNNIENDVDTTPPAYSSEADIASTEITPATTISNEPHLEIDKQLDDLLGIDDNDGGEDKQTVAEQTPEQELFTDTDQEEIIAALADSEEEGGFNEEIIEAAISGEPTREINDKLNDFFGKDGSDLEEDEQEIEQQAEEQDLFASFDSSSIAPALPDAGEQRGFDEEQSMSTINEEPNQEIGERLDDFFGADDKKRVPDVAESSLEETLAINLALLPVTPSLEIIKQNRETVRKILSSHSHSPGKTAMLQLLDATLALLPEEAGPLTGDAIELLDLLQNNIKEDIDDTELIALAVVRFTIWHKNLIEELQSQKNKPKEDKDNHDLHKELKEIRNVIAKEIGDLRREIKQSG